MLILAEKLTEHSQVEIGSQWCGGQQILGLTHQIGVIVGFIRRELVDVLRETSRSALRGIDDLTIAIPDQLGSWITSTTAAGYLYLLATTQGLALAVALKEWRTRGI